jgi:hypothetical protein
MKQLLFCIFTALLLNVGTAWASPLEDGLAAYKRGDCLAAAQGNANAQYNLGLKYVNGQGLVQDSTEGLKWWRLRELQ